MDENLLWLREHFSNAWRDSHLLIEFLAATNPDKLSGAGSPRVGMAAIEQHYRLREGFARPPKAILDEGAGLRAHKTIPSRSTCWVNGIARYRGESHTSRL
jgi:hypothetical protein